jgi:tetratricopeptide (TPR) repeat protein
LPEEERQRYCERILLPQLYASLSIAARRLTSQLAVSEVPLPADGLAEITGITAAEAESSAGAAVNYGLVQRFAEADLPTLFHVPGLLRNWLGAEERLSVVERCAVDVTLARFWRRSYEQDREHELRVSHDVALVTCHVHAQRGRTTDELVWAACRLSQFYESRSRWSEARAILEAIPIANWDATIWHNLATLDVNEGAYPAAREKFQRSLEIEQAIGNKAGEAATWHQLGFMLWEMKRQPEAPPMLAISAKNLIADWECGSGYRSSKLASNVFAAPIYPRAVQ